MQVTLLIIAVFLGILVFRPVFRPAPVLAQGDSAYPFYVEPGYTMLRKPDGTAQMYGKVVIDMRNGDILGFPTLIDGPYPVDTVSNKPPTSHPMYLALIHKRTMATMKNAMIVAALLLSMLSLGFQVHNSTT